LPKIKVFAWRVGHEILPTNVKIASIKNDFNESCPRCGANFETLLHALRHCTKSREVLAMGGWDFNRNEKQYDKCIDWIEDMLRILDKKAMADLITTLCNSSCEFHIYNPVNPPILAQIEEIKKWERPANGTIKINFDATVNDNRMGYGVIIRDEDGFVLGGGGGFYEGKFSVLEAECIALERSIEVTDKLNMWGKVTFKIDNAELANKWNIGDEDIAI
ncbi:hypothetical protein Goari_020409, partial [Gossypium aridum]|nr:hypothetical protein [Gossypium aridum]